MRLDCGHGSPYDRGGADSYYRRPRRPHYFAAGTYTSEKITEDRMTQEEIEAYLQGFADNEAAQSFK